MFLVKFLALWAVVSVVFFALVQHGGRTIDWLDANRENPWVDRAVIFLGTPVLLGAMAYSYVDEDEDEVADIWFALKTGWKRAVGFED